jgi:uncharacterized membrane protein (UPF0127 family)
VNCLIRRLAPLALALGLPVAIASTASAAVAAARLDPLTISTSHGLRRFHVEVARTVAEQERGLMFRDSVAPDSGMIFPFDPPQAIAFWMKNTKVPLDMLFIRADGTIARIAAMTKPYSLDIVPAGEPVAAVLEIAGGRAATLGIGPGDHVRWGSLGSPGH